MCCTVRCDGYCTAGCSGHWVEKKHVPCWKHGVCEESSVMELVNQLCQNHSRNLHLLATVVGVKAAFSAMMKHPNNVSSDCWA